MKLESDAVLYALSANRDLAEKVADELETKLSDVRLEHFPSGEIIACPCDCVRGKRVYIIQSTCPPVNENLMEVLIFIDALKRASVKEINVIVPYFGYARQDRKSKPREPITSKLVADLFVSAGANRILTFDLHAAQIQGFFSCLEDDLSAIPLIGYTIKHDSTVDKENLVCVSPDHGGVNRVRRIAEILDTPIAIIDKRRNDKRMPEVMNIIGDVSGKNCLIVDDMMDTCGTAVAAVSALKKAGAIAVSMACTHPVFSDPAYERLSDGYPFKRLWVTDSIPLREKFVKDEKLHIKVCSLSKMIAKAIYAIHNEESISDSASIAIRTSLTSIMFPCRMNRTVLKSTKPRWRFIRKPIKEG
jgi:ribose-phosphate pyrophosphokinase